MSRNNRYAEIEREYGKPMHEILIEMFDRYPNQAQIAKELGVTQGTISLWLARLGLKVVSRLVPIERPDYSQYFSKPMDRVG